MIHKSVGQWAAVIGFLAAAGVSAAYLIYQKSIINTIQAGGNTISITEDFEPPKKQEVGDNIFKKRVQIENMDETACFVRVFMEFSDSGTKKRARISPDGRSWYPAVEYESLTLRIFLKTGVIFLWKRIRCWEAFIIIQFQ